MPLIETRYGEALVDVGLERNTAEAFRKDLLHVANVYREQRDLKALLLNTKIDTGIKKETVRSIFEGAVHVEVLNFLLLILDKNRIKFLPGIIREFNRLADKKQNVLNIKIYSAFPLTHAQVEKIKEKYRTNYKAAAVKADVEIDKALIGGVKVKVGDRIVDFSVASRVESLKKMLLNS